MSEALLLKGDPEEGYRIIEEEGDIDLKGSLHLILRCVKSYIEFMFVCGFIVSLGFGGAALLHQAILRIDAWNRVPITFEYADLHDLVPTTYNSDEDMKYMEHAFMRGVHRGELQSYGSICIQSRSYDNRFHWDSVQRFNQYVFEKVSFYMSNELSSASKLCYVPYPM